MNKTVIITSSIIVVAALAVVAFMTLGGDTPEIEATAPTATASAEASPSPSATLELVEGVFPIPVLPSESIPWDEIGPGWFLLEWDASVLDDPEWDRQNWPSWFSSTRANVEAYESSSSYRNQYPMFDDALLAVSPAGEIFFVHQLEPYGPVGSIRAWNGTSISLVSGDPTWEIDCCSDVIPSTLDLVTGELSSNGEHVEDAGEVHSIAGNRYVAIGGGEGVGFVNLVLPGADRELCQIDGFNYEISTDGTTLVCLEGLWDEGKTAVVTLDLTADTPSRTRIDTFSRTVWDYWTAGWIDDDVFVLARDQDSGDGISYFLYDITTHKISDFTPTLADGSVLTSQDSVDGVDGYLTISADRWEAGVPAEVFPGGGADAVQVPCWPETISHGQALTACRSIDETSLALAITDLATGVTTPLGVIEISVEDSYWLGVHPYKEEG